jgi:predicted transporter
MAWVIRLVAMALFVGLAWLVFRGPRGRVVGLAMLAIGLYFPVAVLVYQATYDFAPVALPLLNVADGTGDTVVWISVGIVVLGAIALIWPTADPALEA